MNKLLLTFVALFALNAQAQEVSPTTTSVKCGQYNFPELLSINNKNTQQIAFSVEMIKNNHGKISTVNKIQFVLLENNFSKFDLLTKTSYLPSITKTDQYVGHNEQSFNSNNNFTTGVSLIFLPTIVNDKILTKICFNDTEFVKRENITLNFPQFISTNSLQELILESGKSANLQISENVSLKITAIKMNQFL